MHDYSDGFAIVGINPLAGAVPIPATIKQDGDTEQVGNYTHTGDMNRTGNTTNTGDVDVVGNLQALTFKVNGTSGVSGSFPVHDGRTVTVQEGLIVGIA